MVSAVRSGALIGAARRERLLSAARLGGLAVAVWATAHQAKHSLPGEHVAVPLLLAAAAVGWLGWMAGRYFRVSARITWLVLALLAVSGGALVGYASIATAFVAVAGLGAGIAFDAVAAWAVGTAAFVVLVVMVAALGSPGPAGDIAGGGLAVVAGLMAGASRRQYQARAHQAEQLLAERVRADAERDRAAALAERNRVGREVHDVLAHSLGALSVQLDAADALLEKGGDPTKARQLVQQARRLAVQGLDETRQAVHALRDEPVALAEQLASLAARDGVELTVNGRARPLDAAAGVALYRAAQEALTNARKHAPGAPVSIRLDFGATSTVLMVSNGSCPDGEGASPVTTPLSETGGGFGLQGMRERIELLGGDVVAEPSGPGWTVQVAVPA
ncbi:MAG TPA: histidine kinase [Acidimicrobiales bacterium]|jgi:signal transduction histidine kinase